MIDVAIDEFSGGTSFENTIPERNLSAIADFETALYEWERYVSAGYPLEYEFSDTARKIIEPLPDGANILVGERVFDLMTK